MLTKHKNKILWTDFYQRFSFTQIHIKFILPALVWMTGIILLATSIAVALGHSTYHDLALPNPDEYLKGSTFISAVFLPIFLLSCFEEIGWRGYAIEGLRTRFNLLKTSLILGIIWCVWHAALFSIKNGYFQQELWARGMIHVVNYFICLFPLTIVINWFYVKNNRSLWMAILCHFSVDFSLAILQTQPFTKFIIMILLIILAGIIIIKDKTTFLEK